VIIHALGVAGLLIMAVGLVKLTRAARALWRLR